MNLVHLKYAVEVAETGSINKASFCSLRTLDTPSGRRYRRSVQQGYDREEKILDIRAEGELCDRRIRRVLKASRQGHAG